MAWTTPRTWVAGDVLTAAQLNADVRDNFKEVGLDSGAASAWTSSSPTYTSVTVGNGTVTSLHKRVGRMITHRWQLALGSTSAIGTDPAVQVPVAPSATGAYTNGAAYLLDTNVSTDYAAGVVLGRSASDKAMFIYGNTRLSATVPFTWATGDVIGFVITYEATA